MIKEEHKIKKMNHLKFCGVMFLMGFCFGSPVALNAGCDKDYIAKMKFALHYAGSKLAADVIDQKAESFCPHSFIVNHEPSTESGADTYVLKFDFSQSGPAEDVEVSVLKKVAAALADKGFPKKPLFTTATSDTEQNVLLWRGPSKTWVRVCWFDRDGTENKTLFEMKIGHTNN